MIRRALTITKLFFFLARSRALHAGLTPTPLPPTRQRAGGFCRFPETPCLFLADVRHEWTIGGFRNHRKPALPGRALSLAAMKRYSAAPQAGHLKIYFSVVSHLFKKFPIATKPRGSTPTIFYKQSYKNRTLAALQLSRTRGPLTTCRVPITLHRYFIYQRVAYMKASVDKKRVLVSVPLDVQQWLEERAGYNGGTISGEVVRSMRGADGARADRC
jgi:hypothetical protein